jgi:hypothetical protein
VLFLRLIGYLLWIPGCFALIAAVILPLVSSRLSRRGRAAASWPRLSCVQVRADSGPLHVHGTSTTGPPGPLRGRLSGTDCVWYSERVFRRYWITRMRFTYDDWAEVDVLVEEEVWAWDSGPFAIRDDTGSVLVASALLEHTLNAHGHPKERVVDEVRDEGAEAWRYQGGGLGTLLAGHLLPAGLLHGFADPAARTAGYRVREEVLPAGLAFHIFAVPGELDGRPIMATPYQDVWAISAEPMPTSLARGGKRSRSWAVRFGLVGIAFFAVSALFLLPGG